jgi:hypothetical protein
MHGAGITQVQELSGQLTFKGGFSPMSNNGLRPVYILKDQSYPRSDGGGKQHGAAILKRKENTPRIHTEILLNFSILAVQQNDSLQ